MAFKYIPVSLHAGDLDSVLMNQTNHCQKEKYQKEMTFSLG